MLVVASLLAIISAIVVPASVNASDLAVSDAAARIQSDLSYARSRAIVLRSPQSFVCDVAQGFYYLATAQASSTPITDPISRKPYRVFLRNASQNAALRATPHVEAFPDVTLSAVSFNSGTVLTFDAMGLPRADDAALTTGRIEITAGSRKLEIVVDPVTGQVSAKEPNSGQSEQGSSGSKPRRGGLLSWLFGGWGL